MYVMSLVVYFGSSEDFNFVFLALFRMENSERGVMLEKVPVWLSLCFCSLFFLLICFYFCFDSLVKYHHYSYKKNSYFRWKERWGQRERRQRKRSGCAWCGFWLGNWL